ncbi:hypothetical protein RB195_010712 [Necator americanus]|uniref:Uncharacterized protein n=1 Tax=Necator americanus TaxID=51031 RepID=A0ABR1CZ50_NECAM
MGNCISLKKKKDVTREHPTVSKWLASCDFSSVPEIDDFSVEEQSQSRMVYESVLGEENTAGDYDGYITALENLESEDERSREQIGLNAPSSSAGTQHQVDSCTFVDDESVYETSDEHIPNDPDPLETPMFSARFTPNDDRANEEEECDVVEEFAEWKTNYDARPICPLPTPFRKNLISPRVDLETLVDRRGKVRRTERVKLYLDEKRQNAQRL